MTDKLGPYDLNTIVTGNARELMKAIPDESVDLIFTDPPYLRKFLPLYEWLAEEAARVLKPGGFCLAMCGGSYVNQIFRMFDEHLTFFWKYELYLSGPYNTCIWPFGNTAVNVVARCKSLLAYTKGHGLPRTSTQGIFRGSGADKRYHVWGQDTASTRYYVDCFSAVDDIVVDTFCGGGTTPAMCYVLKRNYLAFEICPETAELARERVRTTQPPLFSLESQMNQLTFADDKL